MKIVLFDKDDKLVGQFKFASKAALKSVQHVFVEWEIPDEDVPIAMDAFLDEWKELADSESREKAE